MSAQVNNAHMPVATEGRERIEAREMGLSVGTNPENL
jgi:hypothetical protein